MSGLPKGFKPIDRAALSSRTKNPSPLEKGLQALLVRDREHRSEKRVEESAKAPIRKVKRLSEIISSNIQAANDLRTVTHYIKRAEQIWTTLLLKPNGNQDILQYDTTSSAVKNGKLHDALLQRVENYFTVEYPFEEMPAQIIKDVLCRTGSYVLLNLPHSALDHLINGYELAGTESFKTVATAQLSQVYADETYTKVRNIGFIRKTKPANELTGFESLYGKLPEAGAEYNLVNDALGWTFTDNVNVLKVGEVKQKLRADRLASLAGQETLQTVLGNVFEKKKHTRHKTNANNVAIAEKKSLDQQLSKLYPNRNFGYNEHLSVRQSKFYTGTGRGLGVTYHVPSEACIPVHVNGEIGKPFGYILMVDPKTGEYLKSTSDSKFYNTGGTQRPAFGSVNEMANHIRQIAQGEECNLDMEWMVEMSSAILEKEFIEGFINGDLEKSVTVSLSENNKKLFLSRAFKQQGVRCVFVPAEYVTYIAVDFSNAGIGRSLVEEAKLHITRLAILETADILANVENAISHSELRIGLEKEDVNARNTIALVRDEYFANNPTLHDIMGYNNVSIDAVLDRFKEQSLTIKVDAGDNKHVIAPTIETSQMQREPLKTIDPSSKEGLLNTIAGYFCLKRSWLEDTGEGNDFAIEALADQELLRNQTAEWSRLFSGFFSDFMKKHIRCNEPLLTDLITIIKENKALYSKPDQTGSLHAQRDSEEVKEEAQELEVEGTKKGKKKKEEEQDPENVEGDGVEVITPEEQSQEIDDVEMVLLDFINNFFVELPSPAINETINKIEDKIESINKLVSAWIEMGGGVKFIEKKAEELNIEPDELLGQIKAALLQHAFERFNIPSPFEMILNNGDGGGMLSMVNDITNLQCNVIKFLGEYVKGQEKPRREMKKLVEKKEKQDTKFDEPEGNEPGVDETQVDPMGGGDSFLSGGSNDTDPFAEDELPAADPDIVVDENTSNENDEEEVAPEDKLPDEE
ncbi:hypothetical protein AVP1_0011 [Aeromonas phage AVP1]|nr:hypothetical protein AVP1_0011 [Aeromonas phage AVP1]